MPNLAGGTLTASAHEPYKSLKGFKLVGEFGDSEINASFGKPSMPSATSNRSKTEGASQLAGNLKMLGMAIHHDTWNNTLTQCSIFPLLVISTYYECSGNGIAKQRCKRYRSSKRRLT